MADPAADQSFVEWLVGGLFVIGSAAVGFLGRLLGTTQERVATVSEEAQSLLEKQAAHEQKERDEIWRALEKNRQEVTELERRLLTSVATKNDLREMEDRLLQHLDLLRPKTRIGRTS